MIAHFTPRHLPQEWQSPAKLQLQPQHQYQPLVIDPLTFLTMHYLTASMGGAGRPASPIAVKAPGDADEDLLLRSRDPDRRSGKPRPRAALTDFETVSAIGDGLVGQVTQW